MRAAGRTPGSARQQPAGRGAVHQLATAPAHRAAPPRGWTLSDRARLAAAPPRNGRDSRTEPARLGRLGGRRATGSDRRRQRRADGLSRPARSHARRPPRRERDVGSAAGSGAGERIAPRPRAGIITHAASRASGSARAAAGGRGAVPPACCCADGRSRPRSHARRPPRAGFKRRACCGLAAGSGAGQRIAPRPRARAAGRTPGRVPSGETRG